MFLASGRKNWKRALSVVAAPQLRGMGRNGLVARCGFIDGLFLQLFLSIYLMINDFIEILYNPSSLSEMGRKALLGRQG